MGRVRQVSVLFTDLVDSTALSSSVSPEVADELRREHFGVLRRAIAEADGTEVKNLGDGLMVVFATASTALACAVGMQQATELDNRDRKVPFGLRVGVSAGEVVEEDDDFFGDPVVEAARLCAKCEPGQILAADGVRVIAGRRNPHRCVPVGDLDLKGLPEPVAAVEVAWEPVSPSETAQRVPLPARLTRRPPVGLVGRDVELATLDAAVKRTAAGDGRQVVVVAGEAGLGKTTLVAATARSAFEAGACVLFGHAEEDLATPYGLFAEAFGHLVTHADDDELRAYVDACGPDLARIVPALNRRLPGVEPASSSDADTDRYLLFAAVVGLVRLICSERPLVLVLDDLQWADTASLQLLRHIVSEDPASRLLLLATYRDTEVGAGHPLLDTLAALWRSNGVTRLDLRGLDDRGVIELLEATARHELDDPGTALAHALYRETDGNPFFVSEVLRHLVETGTLYQDDTTGRWVSDLSLDDVRLPDSVREVIGARIGRLDPRAARILSTAAVIGRDFDLELLGRATETEEDELLDVLEAAEAAALVSEPPTVAGRFMFTHALIQRTLYQDLSASRRARAHERVAEALEDLTAGQPGTRVGELAHHWSRATRPADTAKAVAYAAQAGAAALAALAPAEAVRWYGQAIEFLGVAGDPHQRAELLLGLGEAQRQEGIAEHRETLLQAARLADETDDAALLARAVLANNRGWNSTLGEVDLDRLAVIERALERLEDSDTAAAAALFALAALERLYGSPLAERLEFAERGVASARASGDPVALVAALRLPVVGIQHPSTVALRTAWTDEACRVTDALDDPNERYWAHNMAMLVALERADGPAIAAHWSVREQVLARLPAADLRWNSMFHDAWRAALRGDLLGYERLAEAALSFGLEHQQTDAFGIYSVQLANLRLHQRRLHELVPLIEQTIVDTPGIPTYRAVLAYAKALGGEEAEARSMIADAAVDGFALPDDTAWSTGLACWVGAAWLTGSVNAAPVLRELLEPYHDQLVSSGASFQLSIAHYLGLLDHLVGDYDAAEQWLSEAAALHRNVDSPMLVAYTEAALAGLLADRGRDDDRERARSIAQAAHAAARAAGWGYVEADARAVLERLG